MMRLFSFSCFMLAICVASSASADIVDFLDFSNDGDGVIHTNDGIFPLPAPPISGGTAPNDWVLTYDPSIVQSDNTVNEFQAIGGVMRVQDFGGIGTLTGNWVATADGTIDINGVGLTIGNGIFSGIIVTGPGTSVDEGITWFYSINGGAAVELFLGQAELGGVVNAGTDVSNSFSNIAVTAGDSVDYGFTVAVEGFNMGVEISSVQVNFAVPEPSSVLLLCGGLVGLVSRRRRVS